MTSKAVIILVSLWCAFGVLSAGTVQAGAVEKQDKIKQLMSATDMRTLLDEMVPVVSNVLAKDLQKKGVKITAETVDLIKTSTTDVMKANVTPYINRVIGMYNEAFLEAEIDELLAFYSSPTGQKAQQSLPHIQNEAKALGVKWGRSLIPQINADVTAALKSDQSPQNN